MKTFQRRYYVLFCYGNDSGFDRKYSLLTANCRDSALRKAVKYYGLALVFDVITEREFDSRHYEKLYGFTLKDDLTRLSA